MKKIITIAVLISSSLSFAGTYSGGSGTESLPYQITTVDDWLELINTSGDWHKYFNLTADLNLYQVPLRPIGTPDTPFSGVFGGNNHVIRNAVLDLSGNFHVGLFGIIDNGQIHHLGVDSIFVTGDASVGGLAGGNFQGTITSCYATGIVSGYSGLGGLVGDNSGTVTSCYATVEVIGDSYCGGLVGSNIQGTITSCYATGAVSGDRHCGGLLGHNVMGYDFESTVISCYATGAVSGTNYVGGLIGGNEGTITSCFATGEIIGDEHIGGLVGNDFEGKVTISFWDVQTSGQIGSSGGKGLTTEQMQTMSIFKNACWQDKGWVMQDGVDYPRLDWQGTGGVAIPEPQPIPLDGLGTQENPYQINTADDFALVSWHASILDKHIKLMTDIDLTNTYLHPIGDLSPFIGDFNGNGHVIHNAVINQPNGNFVGLFAHIGINGQIRHLRVENAQITGSSMVGGLTGSNAGTITSCNVTGKVSGYSHTGGLIGTNSSTVTHSHATCEVNATHYSSGLIGVNSGTVSDCYATGNVTGTSRIGGLVGYNYRNTLINCYATGNVTGSDDYVGGLVALNYHAAIEDCFATGTVNANGSYVGGLAGSNDDGPITSCHVTGQVNGKGSCVGGLIGINKEGPITSCYVASQISGKDSHVGGLIGCNYTATITDCYTAGAVRGTRYYPGHAVSYNVGGLVGKNHQGTISSCYATADVSGVYNHVGGLVGLNRGTIISCFATGTVNGNSGVGGLVGENGDWQAPFGAITSSYATGTVNGYSIIGGLVGYNFQSTVTSCYATSVVIAIGSEVGGLLGRNHSGTVTTSFWDIETSNQLASFGGQGKTTEQMHTLATFTDANWDFSTDWFMPMDNCPRLSWQPKIAYSGQTDVSLTENTQSEVQINIYTLMDSQMYWTLTGDDTCDWITAVNHPSGSSANPADITTVNITLDTSELTVGDYLCQLTLSADNSDSTPVNIFLHVYRPVGMQELALLTKYWQTTDCKTYQPCSQVDWYIDGEINLLDLQQLAISWLNENITTCDTSE